MLERAKLRRIVVDILSAKMPDDFKNNIFNMSDIPMDATNRPFAINVKTLTQNSDNTSKAGADPLLSSEITLDVLIYVAEAAEPWGELLDEICEKAQWALLYNREFRDFGVLKSFGTTLDDGTGDKETVREGGAKLTFVFQVNETPDPPYGTDNLDCFKKFATKWQVSKGADEVEQTTELPGPWPEKTNKQQKGE